MNKKILIGIAVIALLLVGGGAYVMSTRNKSETPSPTSGSQSNKGQESSQASPKSLKDLLAAGIPQKCTFKDVLSDVDMEGTTYIANGKMRGDFSSTIEGKTTTGHTIFDGKTSYVWMDETSTGFKMEVDPSAETTSETSAEQGLDLNKTIDYKCSAWLPNESLFTPPSDVTFTGFVVPTSGGQNLCDSCNSLSGEQKTQCLTALNCN